MEEATAGEVEMDKLLLGSDEYRRFVMHLCAFLWSSWCGLTMLILFAHPSSPDVSIVRQLSSAHQCSVNGEPFQPLNTCSLIACQCYPRLFAHRVVRSVTKQCSCFVPT